MRAPEMEGAADRRDAEGDPNIEQHPGQLDAENNPHLSNGQRVPGAFLLSPPAGRSAGTKCAEPAPPRSPKNGGALDTGLLQQQARRLPYVRGRPAAISSISKRLAQSSGNSVAARQRSSFWSILKSGRPCPVLISPKSGHPCPVLTGLKTGQKLPVKKSAKTGHPCHVRPDIRIL